MAQIKVELIGKEAIKNAFARMDFTAQIKAKALIQESTLNITSEAKRRCPVSKEKGVGGTLRASIRPTYYNNGLTAEVGTDVQYAPYDEFGTGQRGAGSNHPPLPDDYRHGSKAGMPATPFLYPALELERPNYERNVRRDLGDLK